MTAISRMAQGCGAVVKWTPPVWQFNEQELELFTAQIVQETVIWARDNPTADDWNSLRDRLGLSNTIVAKIQQKSP